jgi:hypothetical protein
VCERRRSVKLEASISRQNQTIGGHSGRPLESLESLMTGMGASKKRFCEVWEHLGLSPNKCRNPIQTPRDAWVLRDIYSKDCRGNLRFSMCT